MPRSSKPDDSQVLPPELAETRYPIPYRLKVGHAERVCFDQGKVSLSPTAREICRTLSPGIIEPPTHHMIWRWYMENVFARHRHWFFFDHCYPMRLHLSAIEATQKQVVTLPYVHYREDRRCPEYSPLLGVRNQEALDALAPRSPIFAWLSMITCGQDPDETWAYFFQPIGHKEKAKLDAQD
jgi:hypothetical protein